MPDQNSPPQPEASRPSTAGDLQRRSNRTTMVTLGVLIAVLLCGGLLCGGVVAAGGALVFLRSRASPELVQTLAPRLPPAATSSISNVTPTPVLITPTAPAAVIPVTLTPGAAVTLTVTPVVSAPASADAISTTTALTFTVEDSARQLRVFDELWAIVHDYYVYTDYNGLNWAAVKITAEQEISAGIANSQFYDLMHGVVTSLNDNHSYFLSPEEARAESQDYQGTGEYVGIGILSDQNLAKRYAYVLQVLPDSPALKAGIKAHDHILTVNGIPIIDEQGNSRLSLSRGPAGTTLTLTVQTPGANPRTLVVTSARLSTSSPIESRILPGSKRIGYLLIPTFFEDDMGDRVRTALRQLMKGGRLDGLIVDMRINNGGAYPVLMTNLGFFTMGNVGSLIDRQGIHQGLSALGERIGNSQTVPLMVLIGPSTQSYAEVYAGALRARGRARLVGQKSAGNIETLHGHDFEDGSEAWIAEETFRLPNGANWEGQGLKPDIPIDKGWDEYTSDNDPVISAAVNALTGGQ
ncbi:MAG TPA: S41 family peptidase [Anaerolineae bacterium]